MTLEKENKQKQKREIFLFLFLVSANRNTADCSVRLLIFSSFQHKYRNLFRIKKKKEKNKKSHISGDGRKQKTIYSIYSKLISSHSKSRDSYLLIFVLSSVHYLHKFYLISFSSSSSSLSFRVPFCILDTITTTTSSFFLLSLSLDAFFVWIFLSICLSFSKSCVRISIDFNNVMPKHTHTQRFFAFINIPNL